MIKESIKVLTAEIDKRETYILKEQCKYGYQYNQTLECAFITLNIEVIKLIRSIFEGVCF